MKTFLIPVVAAVAALGAAGAASAQGYGYGYGHGYDYGYGYRHGPIQGPGSINAREAELAWRIERGERSGRLSRYEARDLRHELDHIERLERQFRYTGGIDRREYAILSARLDRLGYRIVAEMRDGRRYGYGDRYRGW
ncbi:MAG: hypothetical protein ACOY4K_07120 [Pseudomonadota bacterium]